MTRSAFSIGLATLAALAIAGPTATPTSAKDSRPALTGVESIHSRVRIGSKLCMSTHEHLGEGTLPSKRGAQQAAIRQWQIFTADEYGTAWGRYDWARGKKMTCKQSGSGWTCHTVARPCRAFRK